MTPEARPPLLNARGVLLAALAALVLSWPMLLVTAPLGYFDTRAYLAEGYGVLDHLLPAPAPDAAEAPAATAPGAGGTPEPENVLALRSLIYSTFFVVAAATPAGLVLTTWLQATLALVMLLPFLGVIAAERRAALWPGILACGTLTTLPWFASYAMPDLMGAVVLLYYALLVGRFDGLPRGWQAGLFALGCFAVASHYGHLPLAALLLVGMLGLRALARRPLGRAAVLGAAPLLLTALVNVTGSAAALDETSVVPKRLPILLARSIDDGPGARFLREQCPTADYEICRAFEGHVPEDIWTFLWSPQGIDSLTAQEFDAVRAEEPRLLWDIFRAYPLAQTRALLGNAALQLVQVGTGQIQPMTVERTDGRLAIQTTSEEAEADPVLRVFDDVTKVGTAAGLLLLLVVLWQDRRRSTRELVAILLLGLVANALVFGGLSAPVDRYQSRIAWLIPVLALSLWLEPRAGAARAGRAATDDARAGAALQAPTAGPTGISPR